MAPLAAYGLAKKVADVTCMLWENKDDLMKGAK
jgi:hypothetical protein